MAGKWWSTLWGRSDAPPEGPTVADPDFWDVFNPPPASAGDFSGEPGSSEVPGPEDRHHDDHVTPTSITGEITDPHDVVADPTPTLVLPSPRNGVGATRGGRHLLDETVAERSGSAPSEVGPSSSPAVSSSTGADTFSLRDFPALDERPSAAPDDDPTTTVPGPQGPGETSATSSPRPPAIPPLKPTRVESSWLSVSPGRSRSSWTPPSVPADEVGPAPAPVAPEEGANDNGASHSGSVSGIDAAGPRRDDGASEPARGTAPLTPPDLPDLDVPEHDQDHGNPPPGPHPQQNGITVSQLDSFITELLSIEGATGAAVVDIESGMALASGGNPGFDLDVAAAGNSNVVRAKLRTMKDLQLGEGTRIEDVLITLNDQYHLINVLNEGSGNVLFVYLVLNRSVANLALARHRLRGAASAVRI